MERVARWTVVPAGSRDKSKRRYAVRVALTPRAGSDPSGREAAESAVASATRGITSVQPDTGLTITRRPLITSDPILVRRICHLGRVLGPGNVYAAVKTCQRNPRDGAGR